MRLSDAGAALIEGFEGFRAQAYLDPVGVPTIGFGSTRGVRMGQTVTRAQARARMKREIDSTYGAAVDALRLPLTQGQYDALCSFLYNVGPGAIGPSTGIGRALRAHQWRRAADELLKWDKADGHSLPGLTSRRKLERALFLRPAPEPDPLKGLFKPERAIALKRIHHEREIRRGRRVTANRLWSHRYGLRISAQMRRLRADAEEHGWGTGLSSRGHRYQVLKAVLDGGIH